jgi:hypothetical protein
MKNCVAIAGMAFASNRFFTIFHKNMLVSVFLEILRVCEFLCFQFKPVYVCCLYWRGLPEQHESLVLREQHDLQRFAWTA